MVIRPKPLDLAAFAFAFGLGLLALMQWRTAATFVDGAIRVEGTVVELRTAKQALFDAAGDVFATVEFAHEFGGESDVSTTRVEVATPIQKLGLNGDTALGASVPLLVDPTDPNRVRYGQKAGREGAFVLLGLAIGALFIPTIFRRSAFASASAGGG